ncbi:hypothetical protein SCUP234_01954 [Seiridium cupressi]
MVSINLYLTPPSDTRGKVVGILVKQTIEQPAITSGSLLCSRPLKRLNRVPWRYSQEGLTASDDHGPLVLSTTAPDGNQNGSEWTVDRNTAGYVVLRYHAVPASIGVIEHHGGLCAIGGEFLSLPPETDGEYHIALDWNLSHTHSEARAVWNYGDGSGPITKEGSWSMIADSVFMVGSVQRYPIIWI